MMKETNLMEVLQAGNDKLVTQVAYDLLAKELITLIKTKADINHTQSADTITETTNKRFVSDVEKDTWNAKVSKEQLDSAVNTLASGLTWKGTYLNLQKVKEALPNPESGWTVITTEGKNMMYIYEKEEVMRLGAETGEWQPLGDILLPGKATQDADGLMSKEDKKKLDDINPSTSLIQSGEREKWNQASTDATANKQALNNKADKTTAINTGNGLQGGGDLTTTRTISVKADGDSIDVGANGIKVNVVDNLLSDSTTQPVSAKQAKALKTEVDGKVAKTTQVIAGNGLTGGGALNGNVTINVVSTNDAITVGADGITVATVDDLTTDSATKPASARQVKVLNETKLGDGFLQTADDLNAKPSKGISLSKSAQEGQNRPTGALTDALDVITLAESAEWFAQIAISQNNGKMYTRGSNNNIGASAWNTVLMGNKSNSINSNSTEDVATSKAVKDAYDKGDEALTKANANAEAINNKMTAEEAIAIINKYKA